MLMITQVIGDGWTGYSAGRIADMVLAIAAKEGMTIALKHAATKHAEGQLKAMVLRAAKAAAQKCYEFAGKNWEQMKTLVAEVAKYLVNM